MGRPGCVSNRGAVFVTLTAVKSQHSAQQARCPNNPPTIPEDLDNAQLPASDSASPLALRDTSTRKRTTWEKRSGVDRPFSLTFSSTFNGTTRSLKEEERLAISVARYLPTCFSARDGRAVTRGAREIARWRDIDRRPSI